VEQSNLDAFKKLVENAPDSFYHGKFLLLLIQEIEELKELICKGNPRKWVIHSDIKNAEDWEKLVKKALKKKL